MVICKFVGNFGFLHSVVCDTSRTVDTGPARVLSLFDVSTAVANAVIVDFPHTGGSATVITFDTAPPPDAFVAGNRCATSAPASCFKYITISFKFGIDCPCSCAQPHG